MEDLLQWFLSLNTFCQFLLIIIVLNFIGFILAGSGN